MKKRFMKAMAVVLAGVMTCMMLCSAVSASEAESEGKEALPEFSYTGEDPYFDAILDYIRKTDGESFDQSQVMIPAFILLEEDATDPEDIKVWGNFWIFNYDLEGTTLMMQSGGEAPGLIHLKKTEYGYEVTSMDRVGDGSNYDPDMERIFGVKKELLDAIRSAKDDLDTVRADYIRMYSEESGIEITAFQDYGWDPVPIK
ncbi:MAG: hypothetical protein K5852_03310 [Eubacterium sp.]|nr:hypothetical protein [Eubacterium sp.]